MLLLSEGYPMRRRHFLAVPLAAAAPAGRILRLPLRAQFEPYRGSGAWRTVEFMEDVPAARCALVVCDMWDRHWCRGANDRVAALIPAFVAALDAARRLGIQVIHAPSDTMSFYAGAPQRQAMLRIPRAAPPAPLDIPTPPLPIDDSDGGCDTPPDKTYKAWARQHPGIPIAPEDLISDQGAEVYSALAARGATHLLVCGVHTNMCILNRSFAIKQMTRWGVRCLLLRDLTDAMYNPARAPFVSHQEGVERVIGYIERHWAPTLLSAALIDAAAGRS